MLIYQRVYVPRNSETLKYESSLRGLPLREKMMLEMTFGKQFFGVFRNPQHSSTLNTVKPSTFEKPETLEVPGRFFHQRNCPNHRSPSARDPMIFPDWLMQLKGDTTWFSAGRRSRARIKRWLNKWCYPMLNDHT
jgi:hypothetical protein